VNEVVQIVADGHLKAIGDIITMVISFRVYRQTTHLIGRWVERAFVIVAQRLQRDLNLFPHLLQGGELLADLARLPVHLVQRFHVRGYHVGALRFLEGVAAQDLLSHRRRRLRYLLQQVDQGVAIGAVQPVGILVARHRHLLHVLAQLDPRLAVDLHQLVHASQGRLSLAGDWKVLQ